MEGSSEGLGAISGKGFNYGVFKFSISVDSNVGSFDIGSLGKDGGSDNLDGVGRSSVVSTHNGVQLGNSTIKRCISEFLVHVDIASSRLISEDDAIGFDSIGTSFEDFIDVNNFSLTSLKLSKSSHVTPELGLGRDGVLSEDSHLEGSGIFVLLAGVSSGSDEVLSDFHLERTISGVLS